MKTSVAQFVAMVRSECARRGVRFLSTKDAGIAFPDSQLKVNGYFTDEPEPTLAIATGKPRKEWFLILVHEYCHMLQWAEKAKAWYDLDVDGVGSHDLMELWLSHKIELKTAQQFQDIFWPIMAVEWDCERRVIALAKELGLPIDLELYAQKANAYVLFYHAVMHTRRWYEVGSEPYRLKSVVGKMSKELVARYRSISLEQLISFQACFDKKPKKR